MKRWVGTYGHGEENNLFLQYANTDRYALFVWMYQKENSGKSSWFLISRKQQEVVSCICLCKIER